MRTDSQKLIMDPSGRHFMLFRVYRGSKVYWKDCYVRVERKGFSRRSRATHAFKKAEVAGARTTGFPFSEQELVIAKRRHKVVDECPG